MEVGDKAFGFGSYEGHEEAQKALDAMNAKAKELNGSRVMYGARASKAAAEGEAVAVAELERQFEMLKQERRSKYLGVNLYVKNLDECINDERLRKEFAPYGNITSAKVMVNRGGESKGCGFVCFSMPEEAIKAMTEMDGRVVGSKPMYVALAQLKAERNLQHLASHLNKHGFYAGSGHRRSESEMELNGEYELPEQEGKNKFQGVNLYVKNLDGNINDERLRKEFSPFGTITSAKVMVNKTGESKGCGFVCFSTPEEAVKAMSEMDGRIVGSKPMYVTLAQLKGERRMQQLATHLSEHAFHVGSTHKKAVLEMELGGHDVLRHKCTSKFQGVNLYVNNLDPNVNDERLWKEFSPFGTITSAKVMVNRSGESKGFGFVCFSSHDEASRAMLEMDGQALGSKQLYVALAQLKTERSLPLPRLNGRAICVGHLHKSAEELELERQFESLKQDRRNKFQGVNLYVKNLDDGINDERLRKEFSPFGNITSSKVMVNRCGESKGCGFVCFSTVQEATKAMTEMDGRIIGSKPLYVTLAQLKAERNLQHLAPHLNEHEFYAGSRHRRSESEMELNGEYEMSKQDGKNKFQGVNLYVKNLDGNINDERLRKEFSPFGSITSAKVMVNKTGESKGCGFVCFSTPEEAIKAMSEMDGRIVGSKPMYVTLAQHKVERKVELSSSQYVQHVGGVRMVAPSTTIIGQYQPATTSGYFMTTLSQAQARTPYYPQSQMVPVRSNPWWLLPVQPQGAHAAHAHAAHAHAAHAAHAAAGFQAMPGPIRQPSPGTTVMHQVNAADVSQGIDAAHVISQGMMARPSFSNQVTGLQVPTYKFTRGMQNL
ncbi:polyadenylate-binding protein 1-like [Lethenteron reissneri]|uniref:polyadenylate-binding protein 1-like n=1 Tax=Lethenteron reissneri TaxID=7753 RepID=UPI002AB62136|nr:polyadenylate-binding protein 1-like [Lethenteron reissneri]